MAARIVLYTFLLLTAVISGNGWAKTIILEGRLASAVEVTQDIRFSVDRPLTELSFKFPVPGGFSNRAVSQAIRNLDIDAIPGPDRVEDEVDRLGNRYKRFVWKNITADARIRASYGADIEAELSPMESKTAFPVPSVSPAEAVYLEATGYVQSDNMDIIAQAKELTKDATTEYDAVTAVVNHVVDSVKYTYNPPAFDAVYTMRSETGNCTNFAHLSLALLRASGIPARFVAGTTLSKQWRVPIDSGQYIVQNTGQGKHAWIEVFFPDLGWLSYDPAQTKQFTSTRHIKETHGLDYREIVGAWTGTPYAPPYSNAIDAHFVDDAVSLASKFSVEAPRSYLYSNHLTAVADVSVAGLDEAPKPVGSAPPVKPPEPLPAGPEPVMPEPAPLPKPEPVAPKPEPVALKPKPKPAPPKPKPAPPSPIELGNRDFPILVDAYHISGNTGMATLDAETAEYVTSRSVYAQAFTIDRPIRVEVISLAMHKFGGDGAVYVDLVSDDGGRPGLAGYRSLPLFLDMVEKKQGYYWVDFRFAQDEEEISLKEGRYWIVLRHSGDAVMTWFYTPGKGYGGPRDTRSTSKGYRWEDILNYDFVFKVKGWR